MPAVFRPAFHVNRITTIKSCLNANFPMQTSKYAYLAQFSINTGLRVSGWPLLNHSLVELSGLASFSSVIVPDPESKESSVIYGAGWSAGGEEVKISVWWDFENCNVPTGIPAHKVSLNIVSALRMSGFKGPVTIAAYGDTLQLSRSVQEALCSTGIQIHHVPSGGKESDSSDRAILVDLILWTIDHPPPAHLFLISGDRDFSNTLHRLRMRNYNILLACPTGAHLSATLAGAASNVWQWNSLVRGEGLLARSCFDPKPSDGTSGGSFAIKTLNNNHKTPDGSSGTSGGFKISNNNLKVPDGTYGGGMPKNSTANSKFSDGASGGVQNLKGSNVKISAPPSQSAGWNNVSGEAHFKAATQSKIDSTNVPLGTEENGFGGKLEKGSEEKLGKDLEGKQDNVVEWKSKMEQSAPFEVLQQFDDLLKAHPEGIWVLELQHLMSERTLQFDSDYYGHKKLVPFLLTIPEIVRVERRIAKDNKTWTYFLLSRQLSVTGSNSGSHSENSVEIPQLAPKRISKQLINLLKSHPKGLWLNEFQAQTVARKIEFDSDFYGHHKMIPFLLTMPEIVRVERRLMNDRKTWNYFFLCSQNLSLARVGTAKGLPESSTSEKDVGLMLEGAVCEEKHSKISQVDGLEQNQDSTFNKQLQESGEVLDPKPSERPKVFWKRAWQIFSNPFGENLERHSFHSHDQATGDSGIKGQDGRDLTEEINSSQQYLSLAGFLKRLLKGSGNDVQNAPSSSRSIMESNADSQPFGDSSEKEGHMAEKGKYVDGELKSPSAWGGEEGMKIHVESQNSGLKSAHESFHPKNSSNEKRDGRLGGDCESIQMPASQKLQSDSAVIVDASPEWKNQDDNHQNTWKGFLLHFFKTSLSPLVGNNHKSLVGTEVAGKRVDPPLRRKSDHLRESHIETITEAVQPLSNSTENCHIKLNPLKDQVEKGSKKWKKFLFGISEEHASLAVHSDFQSELEPSQIQKCVLDTAGTWEESNSQIQSSDKVLNAMSSNGLADKVSSNEVTTMQGSANASSLPVLNGLNIKTEMLLSHNTSMSSQEVKALTKPVEEPNHVMAIIQENNSHTSTVPGHRTGSQNSPNEVGQSELAVACKKLGSSQEALCSNQMSQESALYEPAVSIERPPTVAESVSCMIKKNSDSPKEDTQVSVENPETLKKTSGTQECCSSAIAKANKATASTLLPSYGDEVFSESNCQFPTEELSTQSKGEQLSSASPSTKEELESRLTVEESSNLIVISECVAISCEVKDHREVDQGAVKLSKDQPGVSDSLPLTSSKQTQER